jgi:hypothetical protein
MDLRGRVTSWPKRCVLSLLGPGWSGERDDGGIAVPDGVERSWSRVRSLVTAMTVGFIGDGQLVIRDLELIDEAMPGLAAATTLTAANYDTAVVYLAYSMTRYVSTKETST